MLNTQCCQSHSLLVKRDSATAHKTHAGPPAPLQDGWAIVLMSSNTQAGERQVGTQYVQEYLFALYNTHSSISNTPQPHQHQIMCRHNVGSRPLLVPTTGPPDTILKHARHPAAADPQPAAAGPVHILCMDYRMCGMQSDVPQKNCCSMRRQQLTRMIAAWCDSQPHLAVQTRLMTPTHTSSSKLRRFGVAHAAI